MLVAVAAAAAVALVGAPQAHAAACTTSWTGTNGDWNNAGNWDNGVPDSSDVACIQTAGDKQIMIAAQTGNVGDATATAKELHLGATGPTPGTQTILISGETLSATDHDASLTLVGGVGSASDINGNGEIQIQRGTGANASICAVSPLTNSGTIQTLGALGPSRILGGSIKNQGTLQLDIDTTVPSSGCGTGASSLENNGGNIAIGGSRTLDIAGSYLQSSGTTSSTGNGALSAGTGGSLTVTGGSVTGNAVVDGGSLAASGGSGTFTLVGNSALSSNVGPNITVDATGGGTADATVTTSGGALTNAGTINLTAFDFSHGSRLRASSGTITNTGTIEVLAGAGGVRELGGTIDNQGTMTINADTTSESAPNALQLTSSGVLNILAGNKLSLTDFTQSGGSVGVFGTLEDSDIVSINSGQLEGIGTVKAVTLINNGGTVAPGDFSGILTVQGNFVQAAPGTLAIEVKGTSPGTGFDRLAVTGNATLDGTLAVTTTGVQPGSFKVVDVGGTTSGNFSSTQFTGQSYEVIVGSGGVTLTGRPGNTAKPKILGTPRLGRTLTCTNGQWSRHVDAFAYRWRRDGAAIPGQVTNKHKVVARDQGHKLTCTVTASNGAGSKSVTSKPLTVPKQLAKPGTFTKTNLRATKAGDVKVPVANPNLVPAAGDVTLRNAKGKVVGHTKFPIGAKAAKSVKVHLAKGAFAKLEEKGQLKLRATLVLSKGAVKKTAKATLTVKPPKP
jgi:hypothetical protein